jgi:predicted translin family RNA/ssDNA-binding protein
MLDKEFINVVRERYGTHARLRREIIQLSAVAQNCAKKSIFAQHRDDAALCDRLLADAEARFAEARTVIAKSPELSQEGTYRAALEEYMEALLYRNFVRDGKVNPVEFPDADYETFIGALSDLTGELQRRQVKAAIERNLDEVARYQKAIEAIVAELLDMDLEGYLRNKFDQAKNSLRRAEEVLYDASLRLK